MRSLLVVVASLCPAIALAQTTPDVPPDVQKIRPVERGFFIELDVGVTMLLKEFDHKTYGPGLVSSIYAGYDVMPILSVMVGGSAVALSGSDASSNPADDLVLYGPRLALQFAVITTERNFVWLRGGGGYAMGAAESLQGPFFSATVGVEHYTKLRHFSIGAQAGVLIVTKPEVGIGLSLIPTLKYTF